MNVLAQAPFVPCPPPHAGLQQPPRWSLSEQKPCQQTLARMHSVMALQKYLPPSDFCKYF